MIVHEKMKVLCSKISDVEKGRLVISQTALVPVGETEGNWLVKFIHLEESFHLDNKLKESLGLWSALP